MMFYIYKTSLNAAARSYDQLTDYKSHACARYQSAQQAIAASLTVIITGLCSGGGGAIHKTDTYHSPGIRRQIICVNTANFA